MTIQWHGSAAEADATMAEARRCWQEGDGGEGKGGITCDKQRGADAQDKIEWRRPARFDGAVYSKFCLPCQDGRKQCWTRRRRRRRQ